MPKFRIEHEFPTVESSRRLLVGYPRVRDSMSLDLATYGEIRVFMDGKLTRRPDVPPGTTWTAIDYTWDLVYRLGLAVASLPEKKQAVVVFHDSSLSFELALSGSVVKVSLIMGPPENRGILSTTDLPLRDLRREMARVSSSVVSDLLELNPQLEAHEVVTRLRSNTRLLGEAES